MESLESLPTTNSAAIPLKRAKWELYAQERSLGRGAWEACKRAGLEPKNGAATKVEQHPDVQARIAYLAAQTADILAEKRARIEARQWLVHDANLELFYEDVEEPIIRDGKLVLGPDGQPLTRNVHRLRRFSDIPSELLMAIETLTHTDKGRPNLKLYSKEKASIELRRLNGLDAPSRDAPADGPPQSAEQMLSELRKQAVDLGIIKYLVGGDSGDGAA
jgi:hypothetical protein